MSRRGAPALKYAVHAYAWTASWSNKTLDLIDHAKSLGFDLIEIPLLEINLVDTEAIRRRAQKVGIGVLTSTACSMETDPTADDAAGRKRGTDYLLECVRKTAAIGATCFSGVTYSAIGRRLDRMPGPVYWKRAASALKKAARLGQKLGVTIGIEPINRYETFLVNTCRQAFTLRKMIDEPNVAVHLDAYHMNIEETDFYQPTRRAARHLCHYHLSESHRGTVGTGTVDWDAIYKALGEANYRGSVGLESFIEPSPAMAAATCIWRTLAPSADKSLKDGLAYVKALERKYYR